MMRLLILFIVLGVLNPTLVLASTNLPGNPDPTFHAAITSGTVKALVLQADGHILVGGSFTNLGTLPWTGLVRLQPDGSLDTSYRPALLPPVQGERGITGLAIAQNGSAYVGGLFQLPGTNLHYDVVRLLADGSLDTAFAPHQALSRTNGTDANGPRLTFFPLLDMGLPDDGKLVIARDDGDQPSPSPLVQNRAIEIDRLLSDGNRDAAFQTFIFSYDPSSLNMFAYGYPQFNGLETWPDGHLLIFGNRLGANGLIQLNPDGQGGSFNPPLDWWTSTSPMKVNHYMPMVDSVCILPDGSVLLSGAFGVTLNGVQYDRATFLHVLANGSLDNSFQVLSVSGIPVALPVDGGFLLGYTRYDAKGIADPNWQTPFLGISPQVGLQQPDGKVLIGGSTGGNGAGAVSPLVRLLGKDLTGQAPFIKQFYTNIAIINGTKAYLTVVADGFPLNYQWYRDGEALPGETNATLFLASVIRGNTNGYQVTISNGWGTVTSPSARVFYADVAEAVDTPARTWSVVDNFSGSPTINFSWQYQTNVTHDGQDAVHYAPFPTATIPALSTQIIGPGTVSFWYLGPAPSVFLDRTEITLAITNAADWTAVSLGITEGTHVFRFVCGGFQYTLADTYIDEFSFTAGPTDILPPELLSTEIVHAATIGTSLHWEVMVSGTEPFHFQWFWYGLTNGSYGFASIPGATNRALEIDPLTKADQKTYFVQVANRIGSIGPYPVLDLTVNYLPAHMVYSNSILTNSALYSSIGPVFSPDGSCLAVGKSDFLAVIRASDGALLQQWNVANLLAFVFSPDSQQLITVQDDGAIRWRRIIDGATVRILQVNAQLLKPVCEAMFSPQADTLVVIRGWSLTIHLWSLSDGHYQSLQLLTPPPASYYVRSQVFSANGRWLALQISGAGANINRRLQVWDLTTRTLKHWWTVNTDGSLLFSPDSHGLYAQYDDRTLKQWNVDTGAEISTISASILLYEGAVAPRRELISNATSGGELTTINATTGVRLENVGFSIPLWGGPLSLSPRGDLIAYVSTAQTALIVLRSPLYLQLEAGHPGMGSEQPLTLSGYPGYRYVVETSSDLINWFPCTNVIRPDQQVTITNRSVNLDTPTFFRAILP
jgi:hypothetical protein